MQGLLRLPLRSLCLHNRDFRKVFQVFRRLFESMSCAFGVRLEAGPSKAGLGPEPRATRFTGGGGLFFRKICLVG